MDWIDRMQIAYEAQTDRMIDEMYGPRPIECAMCNEYFSSDDALGTKYDSKLDFCSDSCVETWEEEFAHEYEEGECELDIQSTRNPDVCTSNHTSIQKVG
ncbi:MAG: hypothetical protein ACRDF4_12325 [Rhabdochlamydiaceae bacterium]